MSYVDQLIKSGVKDGARSDGASALGHSGFFCPVTDDRTYTWDGSPTAIQVLDYEGNHLVSPTRGFLLISIHGNDFKGNVSWRLASDLVNASSTAPLALIPTGEVLGTAWNLYTDDDGKVFVHPSLADTTPETFTIEIWSIQ